MSYINVDINIDDLVRGLNHFDKQQLIDELYDDGYCPKQLDDVNESFKSGLPETSLEHDIFDIINKVWENRDFLTASDIAILRTLSKKGFHS